MSTPKTAQFYLPNPNGSICLYYRLTTYHLNDGTTRVGLEYQTFTGAWHGSMHDFEEVKAQLVPIPDADPNTIRGGWYGGDPSSPEAHQKWVEEWQALIKEKQS